VPVVATVSDNMLARTEGQGHTNGPPAAGSFTCVVRVRVGMVFLLGARPIRVLPVLILIKGPLGLPFRTDVQVYKGKEQLIERTVTKPGRQLGIEVPGVNTPAQLLVPIHREYFQPDFQELSSDCDFRLRTGCLHRLLPFSHSEETAKSMPCRPADAARCPASRSMRPWEVANLTISRALRVTVAQMPLLATDSQRLWRLRRGVSAQGGPTRVYKPIVIWRRPMTAPTRMRQGKKDATRGKGHRPPSQAAGLKGGMPARCPPCTVRRATSERFTHLIRHTRRGIVIAADRIRKDSSHGEDH